MFQFFRFGTGQPASQPVRSVRSGWSAGSAGSQPVRVVGAHNGWGGRGSWGIPSSLLLSPPNLHGRRPYLPPCPLELLHQQKHSKLHTSIDRVI